MRVETPGCVRRIPPLVCVASPDRVRRLPLPCASEPSVACVASPSATLDRIAAARMRICERVSKTLGKFRLPRRERTTLFAGSVSAKCKCRVSAGAAK